MAMACANFQEPRGGMFGMCAGMTLEDRHAAIDDNETRPLEAQERTLSSDGTLTFHHSPVAPRRDPNSEKCVRGGNNFAWVNTLNTQPLGSDETPRQGAHLSLPPLLESQEEHKAVVSCSSSER